MQSYAVVGLLVALALAGCTSPPATDNFVTPERDEEARYVVDMEGTLFVPADIRIPVGSTVVWKYVSGGAHDVNADNGEFSSDDELGAKLTSKVPEYTVTFDSAGSFSYFCEIHKSQNMVGTVLVE